VPRTEVNRHPLGPWRESGSPLTRIGPLLEDALGALRLSDAFICWTLAHGTNTPASQVATLARGSKGTTKFERGSQTGDGSPCRFPWHEMLSLVSPAPSGNQYKHEVYR